MQKMILFPAPGSMASVVVSLTSAFGTILNNQVQHRKRPAELLIKYSESGSNKIIAAHTLLLTKPNAQECDARGDAMKYFSWYQKNCFKTRAGNKNVPAYFSNRKGSRN